MIRLLKLAVLSITLIMVMSACSSTRISYGFLDDWLQWQIDDYITLTTAQQSATDSGINDFHRWHRNTQLRQYSAFIDQFIRLAQQQTIDAKDLNPSFDQARQLWQQSVSELLVKNIETLKTLSPKQANTLIDKIEKKQLRNYEDRKSQTPIARQVKRSQKTIKNIKKWLGSINPAQEQHIEQWLSSLAQTDDARRQRQQDWNKALRKLLENPNAGDYSAQANRLLVEPQTLWRENYRARFNSNKQLTINMITQIHSSMDEQQKRYFINRLNRYKKDFSHLAGTD